MKKMETIKYPEVREIGIEELLKKLEWYKQMLDMCLQNNNNMLNEICDLRMEILKLKKQLDYEGEEDGED